QDSAPSDDWSVVNSHLDEGGDLYMYSDLTGLADTFVDLIKPVVKEAAPSDHAQILDQLRRVVDSLGLNALDDVGTSFVTLPNGNRRVATFVKLEEKKGLFSLLPETSTEL